MQAPLQVTFRNRKHSEGIEDLLREKVAQLEQRFGRIVSCRVVIEGPHRRHQRGNSCQVRIDLVLPGGAVVVNREPPAEAGPRDPGVAIRDAFSAARRQLEEHVRRRQGTVKAHEGPAHARVSKLFPARGYGFLRTPDGREVYFHRHSVVTGFDRLEVGSEVAFVEAEGRKGPQASTVHPAGRHHHS
jgi:cold shock CspA family protein